MQKVESRQSMCTKRLRGPEGLIFSFLLLLRAGKEEKCINYYNTIYSSESR